MAEKCKLFYREAEKVEEELGSEKLDDSRKQAVCSKLGQLVTKLDSSHAAVIQIVKSDLATDWLTSLSENKNYFQGLLKQYQQTAESGNQTSLVSSTSACDKDPNKTVIDTGNGATEKPKGKRRSLPGILLNTEEGNNPGNANSRSSRRRQIDEMELENLRAKKKTEQRLRERQLELEQEHEERELCRQQEELRLQQQQREQELQQQQQQELRIMMQQQKTNCVFDSMSAPKKTKEIKQRPTKNKDV